MNVVMSGSGDVSYNRSSGAVATSRIARRQGSRRPGLNDRAIGKLDLVPARAAKLTVLAHVVEMNVEPHASAMGRPLVPLFVGHGEVEAGFGWPRRGRPAAVEHFFDYSVEQ